MTKLKINGDTAFKTTKPFNDNSARTKCGDWKEKCKS